MAPGVFCELLGASLRNQILETFLESRELKFASKDIADLLNKKDRANVNYVLVALKEENLLKRTRGDYGSWLYKYDQQSENGMLLMGMFDQLITMIIEIEDKKVMGGSV